MDDDMPVNLGFGYDPASKKAKFKAKAKKGWKIADSGAAWAVVEKDGTSASFETAPAPAPASPPPPPPPPKTDAQKQAERLARLKRFG